MTTYLCDHGHHGLPERRSLASAGWAGMWTGTCAGTVLSTASGTEEDCACACHQADAPIQSTWGLRGGLDAGEKARLLDLHAETITPCAWRLAVPEGIAGAAHRQMIAYLMSLEGFSVELLTTTEDMEATA